jgi:ribosomal subunit interface protein
MQVIIQSPHLEIKDELIQLIQGKVKHFEKIHDRITKCLVLIKKDTSNQQKNYGIEIELRVPKKILFASEQAETFETALHNVVDNLISQLRKYKNEIQEIW